ncbi:MAG: CHAT domain-containing tetratricopeptide repeat protein [Actinomycetota bacterium]|nr:CHAT domain-containing tetratricopeptide repeat protein [Actinomycetota bacterium]
MSENLDAPPRRWDAVAREALGLLEEGGLTAARAAALFNIGSVVHRRAAGSSEAGGGVTGGGTTEGEAGTGIAGTGIARTGIARTGIAASAAGIGTAGTEAGSAGGVEGQRAWAVECLRLSRRLWIELGDVEGQLAASENLAIALQGTRDGLEEAEGLIAEALEHHRRSGDDSLRAQSATNLAVVSLRLGKPELAVELCREALPLRPIEQDPVGWAFTAANLALSLTRVDGNARTLGEAVETYRLVLPLLEPAREDYCRTLLDLAAVVRTGGQGQTLATVFGDMPDLRILRLMDVNPAAFGLPGPEPELREVFRGPPSGEEEALLLEAVAAAEAGLTTPDAVWRGSLAETVARATDRLYGSSERTVRTLQRLCELTDPRVTPGPALEITHLLAAVHAELGRWPQARDAYEECLTIQELMLSCAGGEERLRLLAARPTLARHAAYALVRCGAARAAAELLERTRMRGFGPGPVPITASFPLAYAVSAPFGSAVLLLRGDRLDVFENELTSAAVFAMFHHLADPGQGLVSAQQDDLEPTDAVRRIAGPLGRMLQPVVDTLLRDGEDRLTIVPTGPATLYPWAAAEVVDPATGEPGPLGDVIVLSLAPSAAMAELSRQRARNAGPGSAVIFADPVRGDAAPLPGTRTEAAEVEGSFAGRARVLLADEATKEALLRELPGCRYAHLACHGFNDWTEFASMRLLLTGGDVTLDDLRALPPLGARLVFLSACQTGQADLRGLSDDAIGLPFALLTAGAAAVVSTLWPVHDRVTALFAGCFYRELAAMRRRGEPEDVALALQRSRRWLRTGRGFADPYFWAGFVLHGS